MSADGVYYRYSVKEAYIFEELTDDAVSGLTWDNPVKVPAFQSLSYTKAKATADLPGDGGIAGTEAELEAVDINIEHGKISHDAMAILEGGEVEKSGVAPNDKSIYKLTGDAVPKNFKLVCRVNKIGKNGADEWITFFKCKAGSIDNSVGNKEFGTNSFAAKGATTGTTGVTADTDNMVMWESEHGPGVAGAIPATSDSTPPTVDAQSIADGATGVAVDAAVTVDFSEDLDLSTVNKHNFMLMAADGTEVTARTVTWDSENQRVTIGHPNFATSTAYIVQVSTNVKDKAGNRLAAAHTINFTTTS